MLENEFVTYEQALALKEIGFDEPCLVYWVFDGVEITFSTSHNKSGWSMIGFKNNQMNKKAGLCTAPLKSQVVRWGINKHARRAYIGWRPNVKLWDCHIVDLTLSGKEYAAVRTLEAFNKDIKFASYEAAESFGINMLIDRIKTNKNA